MPLPSDAYDDHDRDQHYRNRRHDASVCENTARSTFKGIHVGQSAKPFCSSDKLHPLSAAWAKRWRGLEIVSGFVAHKRNSVFEPLAVEPQQVVLGKTEAADRCFGLQTGMRAMPIVTMQPVA